MFFDATDFPDQPSYDPIPAGDYVVQATSAEVKSNSSGTGEYLALDLEVIEGQYAGRKLFPKFTLSHSNPKAVETGHRILATVCKATKVLTPSEPTDLCGIPFNTRVIVKTRKDTGEPQNECSIYWGMGAEPPPAPKAKPVVSTPQQPWQQPAAPAAPAAQQPATKPSTPPWAR